MSDKIRLDWPAFKIQIDIGSLPYRFFEYTDSYIIYASDAPFIYDCIIVKDGGSDQTAFEATYKAAAYTTWSQMDTDGAQIVRNKAAKRGWSFCSLPFEFETARLNDTLFAQDVTGANRSFITMKAYNASDIEVTTAGLLNANYGTITKTVIDFEPPYDYEIIGGDLRTLTSITADVRLWLIAVPDIAAPTGSKEMGGGINLKFLNPGNVFSVDGRVTKFATYNATYHTNKIRMVFKYPAGTNESLSVVIQLYKQ